MIHKTSVEGKVTKTKGSSGSGDVAQLVPPPASHSSEMVIHACHTSTQEGEAVRTDSFKIVTATQRVGDQREIHETPSQTISTTIPEMHGLHGREMSQPVRAVAKPEANQYTVAWEGWHRETELLV